MTQKTNRSKESKPAQNKSSVTQSKKSELTSFWKEWRVQDVINGVIAIGTLITAYFSMQVWREAVNSTKISMLSTVSANRAWVVPLKAKLNPTEDGKAVASVEVFFANYGKEPAFNVLHQAAAGLSKTPVSVPLRSSDLRIGDLDPCKIENATKSSMIVHAVVGQAYSVFLDPGEYNLRSEAQKSKVFYIKGCFSYSTFGKRRHSAYCLFLDPEGAQNLSDRSFSLCDKGNDAN